MIRAFALLVVSFGLLTSQPIALAQTKQEKPVEKLSDEVHQSVPVMAVGPKVNGLILPDDMTVKGDEGYVILRANTNGTTRWLVLSPNTAIKYDARVANEIVLAVPPTGGTILVYAVALVDGKLTDFARTVVTVQPMTPPIPPTPPVDPPAPPIPPTPPTPVKGPLAVTVLMDLTKIRPAQAAALNDAGMRAALKQAGHTLRIYDINKAANLINSKKLDTVLAKANGQPIVVFQTPDGVVRKFIPLPSDSATILSAVKEILGQ